VISRVPQLESARAAFLSRHESRIALMYRGTLFGTAMWLRYFPNDCAADLLKATAFRRAIEGCREFDPIDGRPCSSTYYQRRALSWPQRLERERVARVERGEEFGRRQAA
jgi:hypothetical protein